MATSYRPSKAALGTNPGIAFQITVGGSPATMNVLASETISEATYKALSDADKARFEAVKASSAEASADNTKSK